ncbi:chain length determinant protein EpsF [Roseateles oligotrophus]|uniref:Chain length determinant protein EpsF n=1 Tax=Roseateles oligotrophus TaxID=1769250 RepID=A0ABT2YJ97_9BURK|nr:chain length determinant protein EpsF [Roseateles oligotrophus]MCV2370145.1 chain length determinant protein EpsF [Roseateles oligotrophus]
MSFGQFIAILRARWVLSAALFALTVLTTVVVSLLLPKQYSAVASVVIDPKPDPLSSVLYGGGANPAFMATQVDVIQSDRVALRVVRNLKLGENPQVRAQWLEETKGIGSVESWLAESFQKNLDVKPSRESNVISVGYRGTDPRFAAALANAFVQSFAEVTLELKVDPAKQYGAFFDVRAKEARDSLEKVQSKLSDFQKESGITAADERLDIENARLNELSTQLVGLQALASDSGSRQSISKGAGGDRMQEVLGNPLISSLKADQTRLEARLEELNSKLGTSHPQVIEAKANLTELNKRVVEETAKVSSSLGLANSINNQRLGELRTSLEAQRAKVLQMKAVRDQAAVLARDVESAQRAYDMVLARLNQTNLESQTTQSYVSVLTQAEPPLKPSSPRIFLNTALSVFVGTLLALGAAFLLEMLDRRVRSVDDIATAIGLPVIGTLPKPGTSIAAQRGLGSLMQQRILGQLAAPSKGA